MSMKADVNNKESSQGEFWDRRFSKEGAIWGEVPSPTAQVAARYLRPDDRVLDIGCGYGRDLAFFARRECRVWGVDLSQEGCRRAAARLQQEGLQAESLIHGAFEGSTFPEGGFDVAMSHRMLHLLVKPEAVADFLRKANEILKPDGILCVGARNRLDLNAAEMVEVEDGVFEYRHRPGHRIRYWDDAAFGRVFGKTFTILALIHSSEDEAVSNPVPCHFTIMVARKN